MTEVRPNYGRIPTPYLHLGFLAILYVLIRQMGAASDDAAVITTLIAATLQPRL